MHLIGKILTASALARIALLISVGVNAPRKQGGEGAIVLHLRKKEIIE